MKILSEKQLEVMQVIWNANGPLTTSQIRDGTGIRETKVRKILDKLQSTGYVGSFYRTDFCGMSQYYYPIIKADAYLRYYMERLQELTEKKIILVEPGGMTHE